MNWTIVVLVLFALLLLYQFMLVKGVDNIDVARFKTMMKEKDTVLIDVRTPGEIAGGKIKNALEIDVSGNAFDKKISELDKDKTYLVYCRSGMRSARAAGKMSKAGFTKVYNLSGGMIAWNRAK